MKFDVKPKQESKRVIKLEHALRFAESMTKEGLAYLNSRGINFGTAIKFRLGTSSRRLITIPLIHTWKGDVICSAIKLRWMPQYQPPGKPKYRMIKGSAPKGVFNFDILRNPSPFGIVANSLFDVMLLDQFGFPAIGPFAGEASWEPRWSTFIKWETILNVGDFDPVHIDERGNEYRPGTRYMLSRALKLAEARNVTRILNVFPPNGYDDVTSAWQGGVDLKRWIISVLERKSNGD